MRIHRQNGLSFTSKGNGRTYGPCAILVGLIIVCYILIIVIEYLFSHMSFSPKSTLFFPIDDEHHHSHIQYLNEDNKVLTKSEQLEHMFRWNFYELILKKLRAKDPKMPSDYEVTSLLSTLYEQNNEPVNFIQVGACDGQFMSTNDPIQKLLVSSLNWHGVMMEPVPYLFNKLEQEVKEHIVDYNKRIYLLNAALSDQNGDQTFYVVNEKFAKEKPDETHALKYQIGSFDKNHIIKHLIKLRIRGELKEEVDAYIKAIQVKAMTPDTVVENFYNSGISARDGKIDILLIDAEGYDLQILKSFVNIKNIRPNIIIYEILHMKGEQKSEAQSILHSIGYTVWENGWNCIGVKISDLSTISK